MALRLETFKFVSATCVFLPMVEGKYKYCSYNNIDGQKVYFYCSGYQTCCGDKCCDDLDRFYRLWYFWLCVLLLLVICSGGGYWIRRRYLVHQIFTSESQQHPVNIPRTQVGTGYRSLAETSQVAPQPLMIDAPPPPYSSLYLNNNIMPEVCADIKPPPYSETLPTYEESIGQRPAPPLQSTQVPRWETTAVTGYQVPSHLETMETFFMLFSSQTNHCLGSLFSLIPWKILNNLRMNFGGKKLINIYWTAETYIYIN